MLADTSVWEQFLRGAYPDLAAALDQQAVVTHPLVIAELVCGLGVPEDVLRDLNDLPRLNALEHSQLIRSAFGAC